MTGEALRSCGYGLRNYLTLLKYAEVLEVLAAPASGAAAPEARGLPDGPPGRIEETRAGPAHPVKRIEA